MQRILLLSAFLITSLFQMNVKAQCPVSGWASQNGVTGGGSATPTLVTTYDQLKAAVNSTAVKVIHISGQITFPPAGRLTLHNQTGTSIWG